VQSTLKSGARGTPATRSRAGQEGRAVHARNRRAGHARNQRAGVRQTVNLLGKYNKKLHGTKKGRALESSSKCDQKRSSNWHCARQKTACRARQKSACKIYMYVTKTIPRRSRKTRHGSTPQSGTLGLLHCRLQRSIRAATPTTELTKLHSDTGSTAPPRVDTHPWPARLARDDQSDTYVGAHGPWILPTSYRGLARGRGLGV
jgi:hypothetical protein